MFRQESIIIRVFILMNTLLQLLKVITRFVRLFLKFMLKVTDIIRVKRSVEPGWLSRYSD
jgi:hypothetical protein